MNNKIFYLDTKQQEQNLFFGVNNIIYNCESKLQDDLYRIICNEFVKIIEV